MIAILKMSEKDNEYTLNVYVPGSKSPAGYLKFIYNEDTNNIFVDMVAIGEAKFEKSGEDYEMRLRGRGIANKLYEKLLEIIHSDPKLSKAKSILGWEPKVGRAEGLKITYDYFKSLPEEDLYKYAHPREF